jgi:hypothetical protein
VDSKDIKALLDYIDAKIKTEAGIHIKKGVIANIDFCDAVAEVSIGEGQTILATYDINSGFQPEDQVTILMAGGDSNLASNNMVVGKYGGTASPLSTNNLLTNGDMESGTAYWTSGANILSMAADTTNPYMGNTCCKVMVDTPDTEASIFQSTSSIACKPNELYRAEGYFMTEADAGAYVGLRLEWYTSSGTHSAEQDEVNELIYISSGSGYIPYIITEQSPYDASYCNFRILFNINNYNYPLYLDNMGLYGHSNTVAAPTPTAFTWEEVTAVTHAGETAHGYITNNAARVTVTLPATAAIGDTVRMAGKGVGGWRLAQNAGQTVHFNSTDTTTGVIGYMESTQRYNSIEVVCITANTDWVVTSVNGVITVI